MALTLFFSWEVGLFAVGLSLLLLLVQSFSAYRVHRLTVQHKETDLSAQVREGRQGVKSQLCLEILEQARSIQLLSAEDFFLDKFRRSLVSYLDYSSKVSSLHSEMWHREREWKL